MTKCLSILCSLCFFPKVCQQTLTSFFVLLLCSQQVMGVEDRVLRLYHDADWANSFESAESIWRGVETALSEVDHSVQGYRIEVVKKNHSGNAVRSFQNMHDFIKDNTALAMVSGIHSPPLIKHREFINKNKILTLVPWAAGGPITRYPSKENWVFRLSVDDTKAGDVIVNYALKNKRCKKPHLLLENTSWGQSNLVNMTVALKGHGYFDAQTTRFDWSMKSYTAQSIMQNIVAQKADCVLLVANPIEGVEIAKAMLLLAEGQRKPIISHWGITAGQFHKDVNASMRKGIDLSFIQSCFSFMDTPLEGNQKRIFNLAKKLYPDSIKSPVDIRSPAGFIHGYDITTLFLAALNQVVLSKNMEANREAIRLALESLDKPVNGLVKTYREPFSQFSEANLDAHEALDSYDYCMARYGSNNEILLLTQRSKLYD